MFTEEASNAILDSLIVFARGLEREQLEFRSMIHACPEEWAYTRVRIVTNEDDVYLCDDVPATHAQIFTRQGGN